MGLRKQVIGTVDVAVRHDLPTYPKTNVVAREETTGTVKNQGVRVRHVRFGDEWVG